jgi:hypothetical protein
MLPAITGARIENGVSPDTAKPVEMKAHSEEWSRRLPRHVVTWGGKNRLGWIRCRLDPLQAYPGYGQTKPEQQAGAIHTHAVDMSCIERSPARVDKSCARS